MGAVPPASPGSGGCGSPRSRARCAAGRSRSRRGSGSSGISALPFPGLPAPLPAPRQGGGAPWPTFHLAEPSEESPSVVQIPNSHLPAGMCRQGIICVHLSLLFSGKTSLQRKRGRRGERDAAEMAVGCGLGTASLMIPAGKKGYLCSPLYEPFTAANQSGFHLQPGCV